ncbi:hypothetical protein Ahy_A01g000720 isoform D [Arachis hypogaea]|uniref:V-SNARE coiled-coil homology domain-containing protein n=1 Tax=Arachis hypogaea TaxID=3818 RepID=A0A445EL81_ARAHY|nr:hypothetical protein Ahy_A01g000720 isoform D [Arachis hypogaea]
MMLKLLITERRRETSTTQVQTFCYDLFASPDNLQLQQGIPVISKWLIYNQFKFVASKGIKLGGIGSVRGYGKRAIGSGRSCPLPLILTIMVDNIEKILERGDRIELLIDKTATTQDSAFHFRKQSKFRRALWMKNLKLL